MVLSNRHEQLVKIVTKFLKENDFHVSSAAYHDIMSDESQERLSRIYTPTSLYIRGRADRIAIHKEFDLVFEWEAKTHRNPKYNDLTLEALPLAHHLLKLRLGVKCLYVCWHGGLEKHFGFWVDEIPSPRVVFLPTRWEGSLRQWFREKLFSSYWPDVKLVECDVAGSKDPFIIIDESEVVKLPHWKTLIQSEIQKLDSRKE